MIMPYTSYPLASPRLSPRRVGHRAQRLTWSAVLLVCAGLPVAAQTHSAATNQPSDADVLLNLFQKKGLISDQDVKEAHAALDARKKSAGTEVKVLSPLPDWVTGIKLGGDFRGRFEENNAENPDYIARDRFRYRLRLGATVSMLDNFEVGFRVASGNPQTNPGGTLVGGQPITANQDLNSLESRKFLWIDAAYAKWTAVKNDDWTLSATVGKMDNPFQLSNMIWDYDIDPEGGALQLSYRVNEQHTLKANGAFFVLDEINQGVGAVPSIGASHDPFVYGAQAFLESKWSPNFETSLGVAAFDIAHHEALSAKVQPFYNSGNSRDPVNGNLLYNFNPIIGTASATYRLNSFPLYPGKFPLKLIGEYMDNPGAPSNNTGYRAGVGIGKAGKKHQWEINYRYQRLEADAWFDALVDDDNGGYYAAGNPQLIGTGKTSGWFGGTNVKGHLVQASYSITDFLNFTFTYYLNDLIINAPNGSSSAGHFMADLNWRF
jgi:hypothetical protein